MEKLQEQVLPSLADLQVQSYLGKGAKGTVFLIKPPKSETVALKVISTYEIKNKNDKWKEEDGFKRVWFERDCLKQFDHPLLPKFKGEIVTDEFVCYAMDYCSGGNLRTLQDRQTEKMFSYDKIRFYAAEIVLALEYLHSLNIVYRDLKPDNILIQENGHVMIVDFDLSKKLTRKQEAALYRSRTTINTYKKSLNQKYRSSFKYHTPVHSEEMETVPYEKSKSMVGSEHYIAPEVLLGKGHDFSVDCWGLGILLYEMLYGDVPFYGKNSKETFHQILHQEPNMQGAKTPLRDLIGKLLKKNPLERISLDRIKSHCFFEGVNWEIILLISRPPYIPSSERFTGGSDGIDIESFVRVHADKNDRKEDGNNSKEMLEFSEF